MYESHATSPCPCDWYAAYGPTASPRVRTSIVSAEPFTKVSLAQRLADLPDQLIVRIREILDPGSLSTFALSRHTFARICNRRHTLNRALQENYAVQHDRLPSTVPELLRAALNERDAAWHMRSLDFWGIRPGWMR